MFFNINKDFPDVDRLMNTVDALLNDKKPDGLTNTAQRYFCSLFQLIHNHEKLSDYQLLRLRAATSVAIIVIMRFPEFKRRLVSMKHRRFLQHLILHLFHVAEHAVELYEFSFENDTDCMTNFSQRHFARGMYPFACYINHSCVPNVYYYNVDDRLICKVIRTIKKGEQIFRSYV